jgi:hypothetical protein
MVIIFYLGAVFSVSNKKRSFQKKNLLCAFLQLPWEINEKQSAYEGMRGQFN